MTLSPSVAEATHLNEEQVAGYIITATKEVFGTMVMMEVADAYPLREPVSAFQCNVTAMVGFAGIYSGIISVNCPLPLALTVTSNMLGMEVEDMCEDVNDALGEIANMLGGQLKMLLSKGGLDILLSIPTVISGEEYTVSVLKEHDSVIIPFTCEGLRFLVGLKLKKEG
jgi:chemotaxis protein CheX